MPAIGWQSARVSGSGARSALKRDRRHVTCARSASPCRGMRADSDILDAAYLTAGVRDGGQTPRHPSDSSEEMSLYSCWLGRVP